MSLVPIQCINIATLYGVIDNGILIVSSRNITIIDKWSPCIHTMYIIIICVSNNETKKKHNYLVLFSNKENINL